MKPRTRPAAAGLAKAAVAAGLVLGASGARAQEPLSRAETEALNYAYASRLGSGVYDISGRTVQIYRLPFRFSVRSEDEAAWGLRVTLQATFGFYDFRSSDVIEAGLPENVDTIGIAPGVEFRIPLRENWLLKPYLEAGYGNERSGAADVWLFSAGVRSFAGFRSGRFRLTLGNDLFYSRAEPEGSLPDDDFAVFETSFEARHALGPSIRGHDLDFGLYLVQYLSFDAPGFPFPGGGSTVEDQYEAGITFGTEEPAQWRKVTLPRVGLGYRFGEDLSALRFVIGIPAQSLKR